MSDSESDDDIPAGWEQRVSDNSDFVYYVNPDTDQTSRSDPRLAYAVEMSEANAPALTNRYKELGSSSTTDDVLGPLDLSGKCAIVTGANCGIGFETAKAFASRGAHVILACRNNDSANQAIQDILSIYPTALLTYLHCDLTSLESVYTFCDQFLMLKLRSEIYKYFISFRPLHMLILNAAVNGLPYTLTGDNLEQTFQVNHLSHFYMTLLLQKALIESAPSRVVVVSSESHRFSTINEKNITTDWSSSNFVSFMAYNDSKLFNILFANELHRRLYKHNITVLSCHPGNMVFTNLQRYWWLLRLVYFLARPFTKGSNQGAATVVFCAVAPEFERHGGLYFNNCKECTPSSLANNELLAAMLWEHSKKLINNIVPIDKNI
ncbi:hypothetical protein TYRP_010657 [Tyrophagus putrescentiae]|nr:hypothetical protein TYRP_010657 [Tyrophagus putrescentiae]